MSSIDDETSISQLAGIRYRHNPRGQIQIESKEEARKRGVKSPDRDISRGYITFRRERRTCGFRRQIHPNLFGVDRDAINTKGWVEHSRRPERLLKQLDLAAFAFEAQQERVLTGRGRGGAAGRRRPAPAGSGSGRVWRALPWECSLACDAFQYMSIPQVSYSPLGQPDCHGSQTPTH